MHAFENDNVEGGCFLGSNSSHTQIPAASTPDALLVSVYLTNNFWGIRPEELPLFVVMSKLQGPQWMAEGLTNLSFQSAPADTVE